MNIEKFKNLVEGVYERNPSDSELLAEMLIAKKENRLYMMLEGASTILISRKLPASPAMKYKYIILKKDVGAALHINK